MPVGDVVVGEVVGAFDHGRPQLRRVDLFDAQAALGLGREAPCGEFLQSLALHQDAAILRVGEPVDDGTAIEV